MSIRPFARFTRMTPTGEVIVLPDRSGGSATLSFGMSESQVAALTAIANQLCTSRASIARRVLALAEVLVEARERGHTLALVDAHGAVVARVEGL